MKRLHDEMPQQDLDLPPTHWYTAGKPVKSTPQPPEFLRLRPDTQTRPVEVTPEGLSAERRMTHLVHGKTDALEGREDAGQT